MAYNTTKDITNKSRRLKAARIEKREKCETKEKRLKELLLKNKEGNRQGSNLEGNSLDDSGNVVKLW